MFHGGGFFQLGHHPGTPGDELAGFGNILGTLDKRQGDPVNAQVQAKTQIFTILIRQRRQRQNGAWDIDAFVVGQFATGYNFGFGEIVTAIKNLQADFAIVEQQFCPLLQGLARLLPPNSGLRSRSNFCPVSSLISPSLNSPRRSFGPCRSRRIPTGRLNLSSNPRMVSKRRLWSSWLPWLKFRRNTSAPTSNNEAIPSSVEVLGPKVARILALRFRLMAHQQYAPAVILPAFIRGFGAIGSEPP